MSIVTYAMPFHTSTPSLGAYAAFVPTPEPPEPPTPGGPLVLLCEGALRDQGKMEMRCVQQGEGR